MMIRRRYLIYGLLLFLSGCYLDTKKKDVGDKDISKRPPYTIGPLPEQPEREIDAQGSTETEKEQTRLAVAQYDDLWFRVRHQFSLDRQTPRPDVQKKIAWYQRNPDYLRRVFENAAPYFHYIVARLERHDMPLELALLPVVESAFRPFAYSPRGASGLWQFMAATGRRFDLEQNWWYDGRRDVVAATEAALAYLRLLQQRFDGDWYLALAAYNSGERTVERAIKRNRRLGKQTDFWSLKLPQETRFYVPSLLAIAEVVADPAHYGLRLMPIPNQAYFAKIDINKQIDLAVAAKLADISIEKIHMLNPGFSRWATGPDGPHRLLIPFANADLFERRLAALPDAQRMQWQQHKIKKGETLGLIAQRYNVHSSLLRQVNRLSGSLIREGDKLLVPKTKSWVRKKIKNNIKKTYTVKRNDSLWKIGRKHGVSVEQLAAWNKIKERNLLLPGRKLIIRGGGYEQYSGNFGSDDAVYIVKEGDSLWRIARRLNVSITDLRSWNRLPKRQYLQPGQRLIIAQRKKEGR